MRRQVNDYRDHHHGRDAHHHQHHHHHHNHNNHHHNHRRNSGSHLYHPIQSPIYNSRGPSNRTQQQQQQQQQHHQPQHPHHQQQQQQPQLQNRARTSSMVLETPPPPPPPPPTISGPMSMLERKKRLLACIDPGPSENNPSGLTPSPSNPSNICGHNSSSMTSGNFTSGSTGVGNSSSNFRSIPNQPSNTSTLSSSSVSTHLHQQPLHNHHSSHHHAHHHSLSSNNAASNTTIPPSASSSSSSSSLTSPYKTSTITTPSLAQHHTHHHHHHRSPLSSSSHPNIKPSYSSSLIATSDDTPTVTNKQHISNGTNDLRRNNSLPPSKTATSPTVATSITATTGTGGSGGSSKREHMQSSTILTTCSASSPYSSSTVHKSSSGINIISKTQPVTPTLTPTCGPHSIIGLSDKPKKTSSSLLPNSIYNKAGPGQKSSTLSSYTQILHRGDESKMIDIYSQSINTKLQDPRLVRINLALTTSATNHAEDSMIFTKIPSSSDDQLNLDSIRVTSSELTKKINKIKNPTTSLADSTTHKIDDQSSSEVSSSSDAELSKALTSRLGAVSKKPVMNLPLPKFVCVSQPNHHTNENTVAKKPTPDRELTTVSSSNKLLLSRTPLLSLSTRHHLSPSSLASFSSPQSTAKITPMVDYSKFNIRKKTPPSSSVSNCSSLEPVSGIATSVNVPLPSTSSDKEKTSPHVIESATNHLEDLEDHRPANETIKKFTEIKVETTEIEKPIPNKIYGKKKEEVKTRKESFDDEDLSLSMYDKVKARKNRANQSIATAPVPSNPVPSVKEKDPPKRTIKRTIKHSTSEKRDESESKVEIKTFNNDDEISDQEKPEQKPKQAIRTTSKVKKPKTVRRIVAKDFELPITPALVPSKSPSSSSLSSSESSSSLSSSSSSSSISSTSSSSSSSEDEDEDYNDAELNALVAETAGRIGNEIGVNDAANSPRLSPTPSPVAMDIGFPTPTESQNCRIDDLVIPSSESWNNLITQPLHMNLSRISNSSTPATPSPRKANSIEEALPSPVINTEAALPECGLNLQSEPPTMDSRCETEQAISTLLMEMDTSSNEEPQREMLLSATSPSRSSVTLPLERLSSPMTTSPLQIHQETIMATSPSPQRFEPPLTPPSAAYESETITDTPTDSNISQHQEPSMTTSPLPMEQEPILTTSPSPSMNEPPPTPPSTVQEPEPSILTTPTIIDQKDYPSTTSPSPQRREPPLTPTPTTPEPETITALSTTPTISPQQDHHESVQLSGCAPRSGSTTISHPEVDEVQVGKHVGAEDTHIVKRIKREERRIDAAAQINALEPTLFDVFEFRDSDEEESSTKPTSPTMIASHSENKPDREYITELSQDGKLTIRKANQSRENVQEQPKPTREVETPTPKDQQQPTVVDVPAQPKASIKNKTLDKGGQPRRSARIQQKLAKVDGVNEEGSVSNKEIREPPTKDPSSTKEELSVRDLESSIVKDICPAKEPTPETELTSVQEIELNEPIPTKEIPIKEPMTIKEPIAIKESIMVKDATIKGVTLDQGPTVVKELIATKELTKEPIACKESTVIVDSSPAKEQMIVREPPPIENTIPVELPETVRKSVTVDELRMSKEPMSVIQPTFREPMVVMEQTIAKEPTSAKEPSYLPPRKRLGWFWSKKQLLEQRYLVVWTSRFILKDSFAAVQMHFISGNNKMPSWSYRAMLDETGMPLPIQINQRMRLDPDQLDGVQNKMATEEDHCVLLAVPVGRDQSEYLKQSTSLRIGFIDYLTSKHAAGIVYVCQPGESHPSYIIHIFPSCTFVNEHILKREPDLLNVIQNIDNLIVVITTA